jgi:uncharacterized membrane protein
MKRLEKDVSINAPIDKVFNYISDPTTAPEMMKSMLEVKDVDVKEGGVGTTFHWVYKMAGMKFSGESVCTEYVANKKLVLQSKGGIKSTWYWTLEPKEGGTTVTLVVEYDVPVPVLGKLAEAMVLKQNTKEADQSMANLKKILEG